jgi:hypothetical protein
MIEYVTRNSKSTVGVDAPVIRSVAESPTCELIPDSPSSPESEEPTLNAKNLQQFMPNAGDESDSSLPDSLWMINCRCGVEGDGNVLYRTDEGETVQCDECLEWSHISCQRDGRASLLGPKDWFTCDFCDELSLLNLKFQKKQRESARK